MNKLKELRAICEKPGGTHVAILKPQVLALIEALEKANEALGFYGDDINWDWPRDGQEENSMIDISDCGEVEGLCDFRGGKRAREAKAQIKKLLEGLK